MKSLSQRMNESFNEDKAYSDAMSRFNDLLKKNKQVADMATHFNRSIDDVVRELQKNIKVNRFSDKSIKMISISFTDRGSGLKVDQKMSNFNESQTVADYKATDKESMIIVDGEKYYIKKQDNDSTHFDMHSAWGKKGNDEVWSSKGLTQGIHIGQRKGEPYIKDITSWLKGGLSSKDLFGKEYKGAKW